MSIQIHVPHPPHLKDIVRRRRPVREVNKEHAESLTRLERIAVYMSDHVGTPGFFLIILLWTVFWLGWNSLAPRNLRFDPYPAFVLWLFMSNMIQICLMPLIMVAQNLQNRHAEMRAENDYEVNIKAEQEIEAILHHLEYQNALLLGMIEKMGMSVDEVADLGNNSIANHGAHTPSGDSEGTHPDALRGTEDGPPRR